jgi:hypothetical protein
MSTRTPLTPVREGGSGAEWSPCSSSADGTPERGTARVRAATMQLPVDHPAFATVPGAIASGSMDGSSACSSGGDSGSGSGGGGGCGSGSGSGSGSTSLSGDAHSCGRSTTSTCSEGQACVVGAGRHLLPSGSQSWGAGAGPGHGHLAPVGSTRPPAFGPPCPPLPPAHTQTRTRTSFEPRHPNLPTLAPTEDAAPTLAPLCTSQQGSAHRTSPGGHRVGSPSPSPRRQGRARSVQAPGTAGSPTAKFHRRNAKVKGGSRHPRPIPVPPIELSL